MPRPCKRRRICAMPGCRRFGPGGGCENREQIVTMTLDEYESVRLIDLEDMTQEQCAGQMNVARTTAQAIYSSARGKIADCLVNGKALEIAGGDYVLCDGGGSGCGRCRCRVQKKNFEKREGPKMRIAVTYEDGKIFQHFGHTEHFKVYDVENGKITTMTVIGTNGSGHGALADILKKCEVDTLICGGIGDGAKRALEEADIRLYGGASGTADDAVQALLEDRLEYNPDVTCSHHGEHHDGTCGEHGCGGEHHCGE